MSLLKRLAAYLRSNPASVAAFAQAVAAVLIARYHPSKAVGADLTAAVAAVLGFALAAFTRPFKVQAFSGVMAALATLAAAYAAHLPAPWTTAGGALAAALLFIARNGQTKTVAALNAARKDAPAG